MKRVLSLSQSFLILSIALILFLSLGAIKTEKNTEGLFNEAVLAGLSWRSIGPANWGGRVDDFAVVEGNTHIFYVGMASGGVWKTTNNGVTWEAVFTDQDTSSIGDIAIAPSNPDIVWVGSGEANNRNSSSWGNGVYKSTDGGKTWKNMGLKDSHHIGRIVIHPQNPDIVYVAALGRLWGPHKERGLFKTTDGGKTWVNTKFIDEDTGFVDLAMDPESPTTLYAAAYQRRRLPWGFNGGGVSSGLFKTTDGGETWLRLSQGLPQGDIGRIGIDVYRSNPNIVYAVIEHKEGGVFRSEDKGLTWKKMSSTNPRPMYYSQIRIDPMNEQRIFVLGEFLYVSEDGGKHFQSDYVKEVRPNNYPVHPDYHAFWINPANSKHMLTGTDGGIYISYDRGLTWDFINSLPHGQFYEVGYDMRKPYYVYGGTQDNGIWGGPSANWNFFGITNEDWMRIGSADGFYAMADPEDWTTVYFETQNGTLYRMDLKSFEAKPIRPEPEDEKETYRFNWNSPFLISPHDHKTLYLGGNKLFISRDRGDTWEATIDLTSQQDQRKLLVMGVPVAEIALSRNESGIGSYPNLTTISESPLKQELLYVGADDGTLQISRDGGKTWKNLTGKFPGLPKPTYVSRVNTSRFDEKTAYATFDGHHQNDFKPYVFMTGDYGETWLSISSNLPEGGTVSVVREGNRNPNLLFVGTERGAYVSIDRGKKWTPLKNNLPLVPVDDIAVHPRENDLIFATHGLSFWILDDITPLEKLTEEVLASASFFFDIREATIFNPFSRDYTGTPFGHRIFVGSNPPFGAIISYYLKEKAKEEPQIIVEDKDGKKICEFKGVNEAGINRVAWDLRYALSPQPEEGRRGEVFRVQGPFVLPGEYKVTLNATGQKITKTVKVVGDPRISVSDADRKAQHDALYTIFKCYPLIAALTETSNTMRNQLGEIEKTLKKIPNLPQPLLQAKKAVTEEIEDIRSKLLGEPRLGLEGGRYSVRSRFSSLTRALEAYTGAPSKQQIQRIQKNSEELMDLVQRINKLIEEDIPQLNKLLQENNIPYLLPGKKIEI